jgi:HAD superfamily hydrolase (TIGR01549 family)
MQQPLPIATLFLDAGGVLCHPSWARVSAALATEGVSVSAETLAAAEPFAKRDIDHALVIGTTDDAKRGWLYFNRVLAHADVTICDATDAALAAMREYHNVHNLWEHVPPDVKPVLQKFRALGLRLVVVSNANGRLRHLFDRVGLTECVDVILDSHEWGVEKPDPRLFHLALEQSDAEAASTAHVGDLFHIDVAGARAAGLREGILLDSADLYRNVDCRRITRLAELLDAIRPLGPLPTLRHE